MHEPLSQLHYVNICESLTHKLKHNKLREICFGQINDDDDDNTVEK